jgi:ABC-type antimicrobial peptide transport system permease subunit
MARWASHDRHAGGDAVLLASACSRGSFLGSIIFESQSYLMNAPWLVIFPGLVILAVALAFNLVGDALRDALDPRQRRQVG